MHLFADGKYIGDNRISGARECSPLAGTKCRNILGLLVFLLAENEATQDARMLPVEERKSALLEF